MGRASGSATDNAARAAAVIKACAFSHLRQLRDCLTLHAAPRHVASSKPATLAKHVAPPKHHAVRLAALGPVAMNPSASKPAATSCDPSKFRIVLDVRHTAQSEGATSARNVAQFLFNLRLARRIEEKLKADGFAQTKLLLTEGNARPSLVRRVAAANNLQANLFLSIHHDSVPDKFLEKWEFEGKKSWFSDRFNREHALLEHRPHF
jgi:N-acetylmuramoyl-L-alanine amidase